MKSSFLARVATIGGLALGAFALSALAGTWTAPTAPAPGGNPDAPVNVGSLMQTKLGWLAVKGLVATDFTLATGTSITAGQVLTAIDTVGNAKWQTLPDASAATPTSGITFLSPTLINSYAAGSGPNIAPTPTWATYSLAGKVPVGAKAVILQSDYSVSGGSRVWIEVRKDSGSSVYILSKNGAAAGGQNYAGANQGYFPVSSSNSIDYRVTRDDNDVNYNINLIGYIM